MRKMVQEIAGKICPIRKPEVQTIAVDNHPMTGIVYGEIHTERKCSYGCAAFAENVVKGKEAFGETTDEVYQFCRMWPGD